MTDLPPGCPHCGTVPGRRTLYWPCCGRDCWNAYRARLADEDNADAKEKKRAYVAAYYQQHRDEILARRRQRAQQRDGH